MRRLRRLRKTLGTGDENALTLGDLCSKFVYFFQSLLLEVIFSKMASNNNHSCGLCVAPSEGDACRGVVDPSEWSYYALLVCAVAAAWRADHLPPHTQPLQRLTALAGKVVLDKCKYAKQMFVWWFDEPRKSI